MQSFSPLKAGVEFVIIRDMFFAITPTEINVATIYLSQKVDKASFQIFDDTSIGSDLGKQVFYDQEILSQFGWQRSAKINMGFIEKLI